ncbi:hypothetical protein AOLI_G00284130 [Acnodon oligacanthus]
MELTQRAFIKLCLLVCCLSRGAGQFGNRLNNYIRHYEGLSYDTDSLHSKHQRAKRALSHEDKFVHLDFQAHGRRRKTKRRAEQVQDRLRRDVYLL